MSTTSNADSLLEFAASTYDDEHRLRDEVAKAKAEIARLAALIPALTEQAVEAERIARQHRLAGLLVQGLPLATRVLMRKRVEMLNPDRSESEEAKEQRHLDFRAWLDYRRLCQHPFLMAASGSKCCICHERPYEKPLSRPNSATVRAYPTRLLEGGRDCMRVPKYLTWPQLVAHILETETDVARLLQETGLTIDLTDTEE